MRIPVKIIVYGVVNTTASTFAAVPEVERGHTEMVDEGRVVRPGPQRVNAQIGAATDLLFLLRRRTRELHQLRALPHACPDFRVLDVLHHAVNEALQRMRSRGLQKTPAV